jgi:hypothetical protein
VYLSRQNTHFYTNLQGMQMFRWIFSAVNYSFYCLYSFTIIDITRKIIFDHFNFNNATNFAQFVLTVIGVFFAYFKLRAYIRDSKIKSAMLEQDLIAKRNANFPVHFEKELIESN